MRNTIKEVFSLHQSLVNKAIFARWITGGFFFPEVDQRQSYSFLRKTVPVRPHNEVSYLGLKELMIFGEIWCRYLTGQI